MSKSTKALIRGLKQMLKNRGSMTVNDAQLLEDAICELEEDKQLKGVDRSHKKAVVVAILFRFFTDPKVSAELVHLVSRLLDQLR